VWVLGQGFEDPDWRFPTKNEMFWQAWVAIVHGAKGIMYFTFGSKANRNGFVSTDGKRRPHWKVIDNVWRNIAPFEKIIVEIEKLPTSIGISDNPDIRTNTFQREPDTEKYLIVVNSHVDITLPTGVSLASGDNIYDLRTLKPTPIKPSQLAKAKLKPGRGNMYLIGTEEQFNNYIVNYALDPIAQIENTIDEFMDLIETSTPATDKLEDAVAKETALEELYKTPPDNQAAVGNLEGAVGDIEEAVTDGYLDPEEGTQLMHQLAQAARQLAVEAIDEAIDQGGDSRIVAEAQYYIEEGDALRAAEYFKDAVNKYKDALAKAESDLPP